MAGAPKGNKNAEQWTEKEANILFDRAIKLSNDTQYDFVGEVARDMGEYIDVFTYLVDKFPHLKPKYTQVLRNLEANCFSNAKKGKIREATAIVNLKSNYQWRDRQEVDHSNRDGSLKPITIIVTSNQSREDTNAVLNGA
jgi:hypothetical protein